MTFGLSTVLVVLVLFMSAMPAAEARAVSVGLTPMPVIRNATALQATRTQYDQTLVLFTALGWSWCKSCVAARNVTDRLRRHIFTELKAADRKERLARDEGEFRSKQAADDAKRARERRVPQFVVFDCSGAPPNAPHHPCATEAINGFPALTLFTGEQSIPYTAASVDVLSLFNFVSHHTEGFAALKAPAASTVVSIEPKTKSLLPRRTPADLTAPASAPQLLLVLPQVCRQCSAHLIAAEDAARQWKAAAALHFTRVNFEDAVTEALQVKATAPYFAFVPATGPSNGHAVLYRGAVDSASLLQFAQYHAGVVLPLDETADVNKGTFGATFAAQPLGQAVVAVRSVEALKTALGSTDEGRLRVVLFVADWALDATAAAFHINAFYEAARWSHRVQNVDYFVVDLTRPDLLAAFLEAAAEGRVPRWEPPFIATCRGAACESKGLEPYALDTASTSNILHFVYHQLGRNADGIPPEIDLTTGLVVSHKLVDRWATLEPIAPSSEHDQFLVAKASPAGTRVVAASDDDGDDDHDDLAFALPNTAFENPDGVVLLVTFHDTDVERRRSMRAIAAFEATANTIARHRSMKDETRRANSAANYVTTAATFATVDGSRYPTLVARWPRVLGPAGTRQPFIAGVNKSASGAYDIVHWQDVSDTFDDTDLTETIVKKLTGEAPFDRLIRKLLPNDLDNVLLDTTLGVLLMIKGRTCPHSATIYPTFVAALAPFVKDQHKVIFASIDVETMDAQTKTDMQVDHFPQFRWYGKGHDRSLAGQVVDMTPFKESLIEFVSDEMGFAHMDLQQTVDTHPSVKVTVGRDLEGLVKDYNATIALFLYNGRTMNTQKFDILARVAELLSGQDALSAEFAKLGQTLSDVPVFRRADGARYKLALDRAGIGRFGGRGLPRLVLLPKGANKDLRAVLYPQSSIFSVISITKWVVQNSNMNPAIVAYMNFTEAEIEADNDETVAAVADLDHAGFVEFIDGSVDAVVLYYATWCRHSQKFTAEYAKVARHFAGSDVKLGRVDVPANVEVGHHQGIQSFPTVVMYFDGSEGKKQGQGHVYEGARDAESIIAYIEATRGTSRVQELDEARRVRTARVLQYDAATLIDAAESVHDDVILVQFTTSWCGHCRHMEMVFAQILEGYDAANMTIRVANIDAEKQHLAASKFNATKNFPVVLLFPPTTRASKKPATHRYTGERFVDDLMKFVIKHDPRKPPQRPKPSSTESKKTATKFSDLKSDDLKKKKQSQGRGPKPETDRHGDPIKAADDDDWQDEAPTQFRGFPAHVAKLNEHTFREAIRGTNLALVLHYATPGDEAIMNTFANAATHLLPLHKKKIVNFGSIEAGSIPALRNVLGKAPGLTLYRGFAQPEIVKFDTEHHVIDDTDLGTGGDLTNVTHVLEFVKKNLMGAKATSVELKREMYEQAKNNRSVTFAVFFYAPYCRECRKPAEAYDEAAQMCGHMPTVVVSRVDITRHPDIYRQLGSKPLPAIFVFDKDRRNNDSPRHYLGDFSRPSLYHFILPTTNVKAPAPDATDDDDADEDVGAPSSERTSRDMISDELGSREIRRKYSLKTNRPLVPLMVPTEQLLNNTFRDFPKGVLVLLTATWCGHCKAALHEYYHVVGALRDQVAVTAFEANAAFLKRVGVVSVPSVIFVEAKRGVVVMQKRKKTAATILAFVKLLLPRVPDHDLPLYAEVENEVATDGSQAPPSSESANATVPPTTPASVLSSVDDLKRALDTVTRPADGGKSFATAAIIIVTTPACRGPACASSKSFADSLAATFIKVGSIVAFANSSAVASHLQMKTLPAVAIHCHGWNRAQPLSRFTAPTQDKYLKALAPTELVAQRINELIETHCVKREDPAGKASDAADNALDDVTLKPDKKSALGDVWGAHTHDSSLLYLRPGDCSAEACAEHDDAWRAARALALDPEFGGAATTDFLLVDPRTDASRPLRRALFKKQFQLPLFAFLPADMIASRESSALTDDEKAERIVNLLMPFKGHRTTGVALVEFLDRMYAGKHE